MTDETTQSEKTDVAQFEPSDMLVAIAMATRLPVPVDHERAVARIAASAWAAPLAGALIGVAGGLVFWLLTLAGAPAAAAAWCALAAQLLLTGALHEDGLADAADGLGAGGSAERIRDIMRDSRIGAYGAAALLLALGARAGALGGLETAFAALIASGAASRGIMVAIWAAAPDVTIGADGLASQAGRPAPAQAIAALALGVAIAFAAEAGFTLLLALACAAALSGLFAFYAWRRMGRLSGDLLGATQVIAEVAFLVIIVGALV
ncbi:MAG: adenosylcobinamide-GDP ribazoletransferase [Neomegalonema sp.]|nr:adenosylcobinamide-GDP ribazoletransferase [Neomegalonema sp.]